MIKAPAGKPCTYDGSVDGIFGEALHGWAWNQAAPLEPVELDLIVNGTAWHRVRADQPREDLRKAGFGDGAHSFVVPLASLALPGGEPIRYVNVQVVSDRREIPGSPWIAAEPESDGPISFYRADPRNIEASIRKLAGKTIDYLALDSNSVCNADCVYCSHTRGPELIELSRFEALMGAIGSVKLFQLGCGDEPTADSRMGEFLRIARQAPSQPARLQLITNGMLLRRHDAKVYQDCRLDSLMLSIDTVDADLNARLRVGTDLKRMLANLDWFRSICPWTKIQFSVVVTSETIDGIGDLVEYGKSIGVTGYFFREVTSSLGVNDRARRADFEEWMQKLRLPPGRFTRFGEEAAGMGIRGKYLLLPVETLHEWHSHLKYQSQRAP